MFLKHSSTNKQGHACGFCQYLHYSNLLHLHKIIYLNFYKRIEGFPGNCSSVQFSHSVVSDSLRPHKSQHARPPCPSPTPGVYPNSHPSSWWCHPAISSSVVPFSSCPQSLQASESFPVSQLFTWGGQSTGVSALASFLPKKSQGWSHTLCAQKFSLYLIFLLNFG